MRTVHVVAVQSYGFVDESGGSGSRGSIKRIRAACQLIKQKIIPTGSLVLWPQGYSRESPTKPTSPGQKSLGESLAEFCREQPEMAAMTVISEPRSWTTINDVRACYRMVSERGYGHAHFYFVTDPVHLRRVKLVWSLSHPPGWTAEFHAADDHRTTWKERWVHEPLGRFKYLAKLLPILVWRGRPLS